jgi:hypothetical protein
MVEEFIRDYQSRHQTDHVEPVDIDTREGIALASLYDIMQYPAIMVIQNDGSVQKVWQGDALPLMDEIASYVQV